MNERKQMIFALAGLLAILTFVSTGFAATVFTPIGGMVAAGAWGYFCKKHAMGAGWRAGIVSSIPAAAGVVMVGFVFFANTPRVLLLAGPTLIIFWAMYLVTKLKQVESKTSA